MQNDDESDNEIVQIWPEGPIVHTDTDGNIFYKEFFLNGKIMKLYDTVSVLLEAGDREEEDNITYCQILAIFLSPSPDSGQLQLEVRWYYKPQEISLVRKKKLDKIEDELFESDHVDIILAESCRDLVQIHWVHSKTNEEDNIDELDDINLNVSSYFSCRYFYNNKSGAINKIEGKGNIRRAQEVSNFKSIYIDGDDTLHDPFSEDVLTIAMRRLHISYLPLKLPCRENETAVIIENIRKGILTRGQVRPLYISGQTGTGKTATVLTAIKSLKKDARDGKLAYFKYLEINCLRLLQPKEAYTQLWRCVSNGEIVSPATALKRLTAHFNEMACGRDASNPAVVCVMDEVDFLLTRDQNVIYDFLTWPLLTNCGLVLVCISNVMDLPERLHERLRSRMADSQKRIVFETYSHEHLCKILEARLKDLRLPMLREKTLEFVARKATAVTGDIRTALKICQRALEIHKVYMENNSQVDENTKIEIATIILAAEEHQASPMIFFTTNACLLDKAILISICRHCKLVAEGPISQTDLYHRLSDFLAIIKTKPNFAEYTLSIDGYYDFKYALERMCDNGMLKINNTDIELKWGAEPTYITNLPHVDILGALKGHPYLSFV